MVHNLISAANSGSQNPNGRPNRLRLILIAVVSAVAIAGCILIGLKIYANSLPEPNAKPTVAGAAGASLSAAAAEGKWAISTGSSAQYRVGEVLGGNQVEVTGVTKDVTGDITISGSKLEAAQVKVDLTKVTTDDESRDEQFRKIVIDVTKNPAATFALKSPVALPDLTGAAAKIAIVGDLTINGTTKSVNATAEVAAKSTTAVSATVDIPVTWADFGVTPPDLGFVKVESDGSIEVSLDLAKS